jgi:hypothetical protein
MNGHDDAGLAGKTRLEGRPISQDLFVNLKSQCLGVEAPHCSNVVAEQDDVVQVSDCSEARVNRPEARDLGHNTAAWTRTTGLTMAGDPNPGRR